MSNNGMRLLSYTDLYLNLIFFLCQNYSVASGNILLNLGMNGNGHQK